MQPKYFIVLIYMFCLKIYFKFTNHDAANILAVLLLIVHHIEGSISKFINCYKLAWYLKQIKIKMKIMSFL